MVSQHSSSPPNEPQNVFRLLDDMQEQLKYLRRHMLAYAALRRLAANFVEAPQANEVRTPILKWTLVEPPDLMEVDTDLDLLPDPSRLAVVKAMAAVHAQEIKKFTASFLVNATVVTEELAKTGDTDEPSREAGKSGG